MPVCCHGKRWLLQACTSLTVTVPQSRSLTVQLYRVCTQAASRRIADIRGSDIISQAATAVDLLYATVIDQHGTPHAHDPRVCSPHS
jgi:hypothetical protein